MPRIFDNIEQDILTDYLDAKTAGLKKLNENIENQITALQQYRKSLIHECVTGKRRITEEDVRVVQQY
jgi:type I restriction enzyme S subunit